MSYATFFGPKLRKQITSDVSNVLDCCLSKYQRELFFFLQKQHRIIENCIWISSETIEICSIHSLVANCQIRFTNDCKQIEHRTLG